MLFALRWIWIRLWSDMFLNFLCLSAFHIIFSLCRDVKVVCLLTMLFKENTYIPKKKRKKTKNKKRKRQNITEKKKKKRSRFFICGTLRNTLYSDRLLLNKKHYFHLHSLKSISSPWCVFMCIQGKLKAGEERAQRSTKKSNNHSNLTTTHVRPHMKSRSCRGGGLQSGLQRYSMACNSSLTLTYFSG